MDLRRELRQKNQRYKQILQSLNELPDEIAEAEAECAELAEALEEAKKRLEEGQEYNEASNQLDEYCREIERLIDLLRNWCANNPGYCANLAPRLAELLASCPENEEDWDQFFRDLNRVIDMKKVVESELDEQEEDIEEAITDHENDIEEAEDRIDDLEDDFADAVEEADRMQRDLDEARAAAAAASRERERQRAEREARQRRYQDLAGKVREGGDAGEEALKKLIQEMGLSVLDDVSGDLKLGKVIGGLITLANMPDCVCNLLESLKGAMIASRRGEDMLVLVYANEYIRGWKDCAGLPSISSVMEGSSQLADAISGMSDAQLDRAIEALARAIQMSEC